MKERFAGEPDIARVSEFFHFACTSEDINNLAYGLMIGGARRSVLMPTLTALIGDLRSLAHQHGGSGEKAARIARDAARARRAGGA